MWPDLLRRKSESFVLWLPRDVAVAPRLVIGVFHDGDPPELDDERRFDLRQSAPGLWERPAVECGLTDGRVYHYWFELTNTNVYKPSAVRLLCTDPTAWTVDWRLLSPPLGAPFDDDDRDPAAVVKYDDGRLLPCDPGGETLDWSGDAPLAQRPANNRLVIYELPTSWVRTGQDGGRTVGVGTFRDVMALVGAGVAPATFPELPALAAGRSHLLELGVNALELLPPADSFNDRVRAYNLWGYATSNYFAADFDLGRPGGEGAPRASADLAALVALCHRSGLRFFYDAVMAFSRNDPYQNAAFPDFHVQFGVGDPEQGQRDGFGADLFKYGLFKNGWYDPLSGATRARAPARAWMCLHLVHWLLHYRIDGIRMDSVENVSNYDFVQEARDTARATWAARWSDEQGAAPGADERFLVAGEELSVPLALVEQGRLDALWNEPFKHGLRRVLLGRSADFADGFEDSVRTLVDCRRRGFRDGAQAINYVTSHDVGGLGNERLYDFLVHNGVVFAEERIKLAFAVLLTAVGIPMILAGEEFADQHDLDLASGERDLLKQIDPVNYERLEEPWRRRVFEHVRRLVRLRTRSEGLAVNDTEFIHSDFAEGRRVLAWLRGPRDSADMVVVVANFSDWGTPGPGDSGAEYRVAGWPTLPPGRYWREVTQQRYVPEEWAGREPLYPWEAKVYEVV